MNPQAALRMVIVQTPILPCPFCGESGEMGEGSDQDMQAKIPYHFIACTRCGSRGPKFSEYGHGELLCKSNAVSAWNLRSFK